MGSNSSHEIHDKFEQENSTETISYAKLEYDAIISFISYRHFFNKNYEL